MYGPGTQVSGNATLPAKLFDPRALTRESSANRLAGNFCTNRDLAGSSNDNYEFADKSSKIRSLVSLVFIVRFNN